VRHNFEIDGYVQLPK